MKALLIGSDDSPAFREAIREVLDDVEIVDNSPLIEDALSTIKYIKMEPVRIEPIFIPKQPKTYNKLQKFHKHYKRK